MHSRRFVPPRQVVGRTIRGTVRRPPRALVLAFALPLLFACIEPVSVGTGGDTEPPTIGGGQPSGTLPAGTTQATLGVTTNESATCRWGTSAALAYDDLPAAFTTTGGTVHATDVPGLTGGQSYEYHVRCRDGTGNASAASFVISFEVATGPDVTAPSIGNAQPTGTLPAGTTQATLSVSTSEAATCRWSESASDAFADMPNAFATTGGTAHSSSLTGLADGQSYTYYVACQDGIGNTSTSSHVVSFSVAAPADVTAPVISNPQPAGTLPAGTRQVSIRVTTNEPATCRYGMGDAAYAQLPSVFSTTGDTSHVSLLVGFADGQSYTFFVRCRDQAGNVNLASTTITFAVASP